MPDDTPETFEVGELLSAAALNRLQKAILDRLAAHDHSGGAQGAPIDTPGLADRAVTEPKLADGAVTGAKLGDGAVSTRALAEDAVGAAQIAPQAVGTRALEDASVTGAKLSADVRALLTRLGSGASSASQVIWRDPFIVYPSDTNSGIFDGIVNPGSWTWPIEVVAVNDENVPIRLNPNVDTGKILEVIDFGVTQPAALSIIESQLNWAVEDAADNILSVGAAGLAPAVEFARSGMGGAAGFGGAQPAGGMMMLRSLAMTSGSAGMPDTSGTGSAGRASGAGIAPTGAALAAAKRMTTIANVDATGKPVAADSPDAITVSAGFSGQENFTGKGSGSGGAKIDFRALSGANAGAKKDAAEAAGQMLFNLGLDAEYAHTARLSQAMSDHLGLAYAGDGGFFDARDSLWADTSWLPEILNRPELFGTGYSLSGGRNIQSVTRQFTVTDGKISDHWVRVRFITPYRNAAYAVTVTPRMQPKYEMIGASIRAKTTTYVDLQFTGAGASDGGGVRFDQISKLSFDLAIFGDLGQAA